MFPMFPEFFTSLEPGIYSSQAISLFLNIDLSNIWKKPDESWKHGFSVGTFILSIPSEFTGLGKAEGTFLLQCKNY